MCIGDNGLYKQVARGLRPQKYYIRDRSKMPSGYDIPSGNPKGSTYK